jgi:hypothetical protein
MNPAHYQPEDDVPFLVAANGAVRAFLRLEAERLRSGMRWYAVKQAITRDAVRHYLPHPCFLPPQRATA